MKKNFNTELCVKNIFKDLHLAPITCSHNLKLTLNKLNYIIILIMITNLTRTISYYAEPVTFWVSAVTWSVLNLKTVGIAVAGVSLGCSALFDRDASRMKKSALITASVMCITTAVIYAIVTYESTYKLECLAIQKTFEVLKASTCENVDSCVISTMRQTVELIDRYRNFNCERFLGALKVV